MSKITRFVVEIVTNDDITTQEMRDYMAESIAIAIGNCVGHTGIVPEDSNTFPKEVRVKEANSNEIHERTLY